MSNNIKVNPFYPLEGLAVSGLNDIIGNIPVPSPGVPKVEVLAELITQYCTTVFFNAANVATIDQAQIYGLVTEILNNLSSDSWCADCCDNTFNSYKQMQAKIEAMGIFTEMEMTYINQIIGMPCNPQVLIDADEIERSLNTIQTSLLVENNISSMNKVSVLMLISASKSMSRYWINNVGGAWITYTNPTPVDLIRPLWLASLLGSIVSLNYLVPTGPSSIFTVQTVQGLVGMLAGSSSYAILR